MKTTVDKLCSLIDSVNGKVLLAAHSKNGIMISLAAEYRPDKIEKLVYLAACLVPNGKTQREYSLQDTAGWLKPYVTHQAKTNSHTLQPEIYKERLYHDCEEGITEPATVLLNHEPAESGMTPRQLTEENFGRVPRVYIECTEDRAITPFIQRKMYTELPCGKVYRLPAGHSPLFSQPKELVDILPDL